jgi:DNA-directed RNA polymerase omega subunit
MEIPEDVGSKFRLIVLAGQRVAQLQRGARPRIEQENNEKLTEMALQEVLEGKIGFHLRPDARRIQDILDSGESSAS